MKRLVTAAAVFALASCGPEPVAPDSRTCIPPIDTNVSPQPMGSPPVWEDRGVAFQRPGGRGMSVQTWLPRNYNEGSVYPILEGDTAHARFRFMIGDAYEPISVRLLLFVEGRPVEFIAGGSRVSGLDLDAPAGLAEGYVQIPPDQLAPGLNQVNPITFYEIRHEGRSVLKFTYGSVFSIANGSSTPQVYEDDMSLEVGEFQSGSPTRPYRTLDAHPELGELGFNRHNRFIGALDNPTHIRLRIQPSTPFAACPGAVERQIIVAFRDGELVPMGDRDRIVVSVGEGQQFVHRFDLPIWPEDGENHHYGMALLTGFGRPARTSGGGVAPWAITLPPLAEVQWLVPSGT